MRKETLLFLLLSCCSACEPKETQRQAADVPTAIPPYVRDDWGRWTDADHDCQDTRQEVLIAESEVPVTFIDPLKPCRVASGRWVDRYSGQAYTDPASVQIDHVVALEEAHKLGGWQWTPEQKKAYFNDLSNPDHLVAVSQSSNASKGSRPPPDWMPPNTVFRCEYLRRRVKILIKYKLQYDCGQYADLMATNCR